MTPGTHIRKYELIEKIGEGGMGVVWKARDMELDRPVVIKAIHEDFALHTELRNRFIDEARIQARLVHPNICTLFDAFEETRQLFLVMELIEGSTLKDLIAAEHSPLPVARTLEIARGVLDGLQFAHQHGVVHRDIKPSNIMVDIHGHVKIMDFGIAKAAGAERMGKTKTGLTLGTPEYMSPEQIQGMPVDGRSDLYSFGIVLYEMLTSDLPFVATSSEFQIQKFHVEGPVPSARARNTDVPAWLDNVVKTCMAKKPEDRFASAGDARTRLNLGDRAGAGADAVHTLRPTSKPHTRWIVAGAAVAALLCLLVGGMFWVSHAARHRHTRQPDAPTTAAEQRAAEQRVAEQRVAEQRAAEQRAAEQRVAEQRAAEQRAAEQRAAEQRAAEQRAAEQLAVEQLTPVGQDQKTVAASVSPSHVATKTAQQAATASGVAVQAASQPAEPPAAPLRELLHAKNDLPQQREVKLSNSAAIQFVLVPAGRFVMGSPMDDETRRNDETPQHQVHVTRPFYLSIYEVTQAQWRQLMGGRNFRFMGDDAPAHNIGWQECMEFCQALTQRERMAKHISSSAKFRLPTEAEWEYACRAGTTTRYSCGEDKTCLDATAWYLANAGKALHRAGQKAPNAFGLYDMHGNVWEWCADWYDADYYRSAPEADPPGPSGGIERVIRGGGWDDRAAFARSAARGHIIPNYIAPDVGFRILLTTD